jgi:TonB-linked SusC/RagA family outer membrane protein
LSNVSAQTKISLNLENVTLHQVIWEIEKQTDFDFIYSTSDVKSVKIAKLVFKDQPIEKVLNEALTGSGLIYEYHDGVVVIKPDPNEKNTLNKALYIIVNGIITDNFGDLLSGVSISVKGDTRIGTITDIEGHYELKIPVSSDQILQFSYIGMKKQEQKIPAKGGVLNLVLQIDEPELNEVVVTGYGNLRKSLYAGSASVIKTENIENVPVVSMNSLLVGNASGLTVASGSNQPGSLANVRIRGMGSINASKLPLYVIDGVPVISGDISAVGSDNTPGMDAMSTINVSDIENIAVIKDAAAASLYGSRAANGVILITTKSGRKGKTVFRLKTDAGFSDFAMDYRTVMDGKQRREILTEGLYNEAVLKGNTPEAAQNYANTNINLYAPMPWCGYVDWDKVLFQKGYYQSTEASATGGNDKLKFYSSLNYTNQEGNTINSGLKRISGRINIDWQAANQVIFGLKTLFLEAKQDVFTEGTVYTSPFYSSRNSVIPSDPVYLEDGSYNRNFIRNSDRNPKLSQKYNFKKETLARAFNTIYGEYTFVPDIKFKSTFSYDFTLSDGNTWEDPRTSDGRNSNGSRTKRINKYTKWVWSNSLGYNRRITGEHFLDALVAFDMEEYNYDYLSGSKNNFVDPDLNAITNGAELTGMDGSPSGWRMASFISRANYNFSTRYYLGASFRYDGSSRLPRVNNARWGSFWSVSGAWNVGEEAFMENAKNIFSDLRLRLSYGTNGTLPLSNYGYYDLSSLAVTYMGESGINRSQIANPDLKWEKNLNLNFGLDFGLFHRIGFVLELYNRTTKDLLMAFPISYTTGFDSYLRNIGSVRNRGFEVEVHSFNINKKNFRWTTRLNLGHNKNTVVKWDGAISEKVDGNFLHKEGMPYYTYYLIEFAGIDPADGEAQFYLNKKNGDGTINRGLTKDYRQADRVTFTGSEPLLNGGITNSFSYKCLDLHFMFNYSYGGYSYDNGAQKSEHGGNDMKANVPAYYEKRWKNPGDITDIERFVANRSTSMANIDNSRRLHPINFIRLKNLTFGLKAPQSWARAIHGDQIRFYTSGTNLLTWSKWTGYDPESTRSDGYVAWEQPPMKTLTFGVEIKF